MLKDPVRLFTRERLFPSYVLTFMVTSLIDDFYNERYSYIMVYSFI